MLWSPFLRTFPGLLPHLLAFVGSLLSPAAAATPDGWVTLEPGLSLGTFRAPQAAATGDSLIRALRIDPHHWELRLLNASAPGQGKLLTARQWCRKNDLVAAINPSMYQADHRRSVSLMRTRDHVNNPRLSKDNTVLAFDALDDGVPPVQIIDRKCQDFEALRPKYGSLIQSIRMISCGGTNVWKQQPTRWSTAAIGADTAGNILFIHVRSPYSTHDLIENLLALPIDLKSAMYAEGGAEAQLYINAGGQEHEFVGRFDSALLENVDPTPIAIPNVVGIARRAAEEQRP